MSASLAIAKATRHLPIQPSVDGMLWALWAVGVCVGTSPNWWQPCAGSRPVLDRAPRVGHRIEYGWLV
jgi:hypothetical protein